MQTLKKFLALIILLLLAAFGISIQLKAAIGIAPFDAMNQSIAYVTGLRVGDVVTIAQVSFVVIQLLILRKRAQWSILLQVIVGALLGQFINLFLYGIFDAFVVENYFLRFIMLLAGSLWVPIFIGGVMVLDFVTMPLESLAMVVSKEINRSFGQVRQWMDIACLVISLILTFAYSVPFTIREGTIISALTFGPLLSFYMPRITPWLSRLNLVDNQ